MPPKKTMIAPPPTLASLKAQRSSVKVLPSLKTIQITPGLAVQPVPLAAVPAFGVVEWHRRPDGSFEPKLVSHDEWVGLSDMMTDKIGVSISRETLIRLGRAGFIRLRRPTPGLIEVHIGSLIDHFESVEDEEFWTPERTRQYREAL